MPRPFESFNKTSDKSQPFSGSSENSYAKLVRFRAEYRVHNGSSNELADIEHDAQKQQQVEHDWQKQQREELSKIARVNYDDSNTPKLIGGGENDFKAAWHSLDEEMQQRMRSHALGENPYDQEAQEQLIRLALIKHDMIPPGRTLDLNELPTEQREEPQAGPSHSDQPADQRAHPLALQLLGSAQNLEEYILLRIGQHKVNLHSKYTIQGDRSIDAKKASEGYMKNFYEYNFIMNNKCNENFVAMWDEYTKKR